MQDYWLIGLLMVFSAAVNAEPSPNNEPTKVNTRFVASPYQSEITYQSPQLANWQIGVRYITERPFAPQWLYSRNLDNNYNSVRVFASRRILHNQSHRIFAALQTGTEDNMAYSSWIYLPHQVGSAASLGWQMGDLRSVSMAVEYEYREVENKNINSLLLGVEYYF